MDSLFDLSKKFCLNSPHRNGNAWEKKLRSGWWNQPPHKGQRRADRRGLGRCLEAEEEGGKSGVTKRGLQSGSGKPVVAVPGK